VLAAWTSGAACGGQGTAELPPLSVADGGVQAADGGGAPDGRVAGIPSLGCQNASDCPSSERAECVPISDGFRACAAEPPAPATEPGVQDDDESCDSARPCETGTCYAVAIWPGGAGYCGAGGVDVLNRCLVEECSSDADCPDNGFCAPRGVVGQLHRQQFPLRHCIPAACKANAGCTDRPGGVCALVGGDCVPSEIRIFDYFPPQLACVYPDGCTHHADCPQRHECTVVDGAAVCVSG
jgi:hypothetical protein